MAPRKPVDDADIDEWLRDSRRMLDHDFEVIIDLAVQVFEERQRKDRAHVARLSRREHALTDILSRYAEELVEHRTVRKTRRLTKDQRASFEAYRSKPSSDDK